MFCVLESWYDSVCEFKILAWYAYVDDRWNWQLLGKIPWRKRILRTWHLILSKTVMCQVYRDQKVTMTVKMNLQVKVLSVVNPVKAVKISYLSVFRQGREFLSGSVWLWMWAKMCCIMMLRGWNLWQLSPGITPDWGLFCLHPVGTLLVVSLMAIHLWLTRHFIG